MDSLGYDSVPDYDLIYKLIRDIAGKGDGFSPGSMLYDWQLDVAQEEDPCTQPVIELQENHPAELEEDCVMPDAEESVDAMEAGNTEGPPAKFIKTLASRSIKGRTRSAVASLRALKPFLNAGGRVFLVLITIRYRSRLVLEAAVGRLRIEMTQSSKRLGVRTP